MTVEAFFNDALSVVCLNAESVAIMYVFNLCMFNHGISMGGFSEGCLTVEFNGKSVFFSNTEFLVRVLDSLRNGGFELTCSFRVDGGMFCLHKRTGDFN